METLHFRIFFLHKFVPLAAWRTSDVQLDAIG